MNEVNTFQPPETKKELQRFLGLVNCFKAWSTKLTAKNSKMREALKEGIKYKLNEEVKKEFEQRSWTQDSYNLMINQERSTSRTTRPS